jgi:NAD(P)-dependent dehydrogenase (short-subunit alcohol dehydrogenase family)
VQTSACDISTVMASPGMDKPLKDKVIIVTGAAGGIGRACAVTLAEAGALLVLTDIVDCDATIAAVREFNNDAAFIRADVGVESDVEELVAQTVRQFGRLDGAFNNAGVEQCATPLHELTSAQWERAVRIDLTGVFFCLKHEIRAMLKSGGGAIVNTASALGAVAIPNASEYVTSKHGVVGLTRAAAVEYGAHGIRVNAVLPGVIETPMLARAAADPAFSTYLEKLRTRNPAGRFGQPSEIGDAVAWLLSDSASFVMGASIPVDGGALAGSP